MLIKNLFERDIFRPINGVVKADQLDDSSVWQELDEFVITRELDQHFRKFISWYLEAVDQGKNPDPTGKMGIWISGFFGSGKSHFLKVLSYLLQQPHPHEQRPEQAGGRVLREQDQGRHALCRHQAGGRRQHRCHPVQHRQQGRPRHGTGRDLILRVFLKVLNELQGYSGDHPHIAHMERYLESKGKLKAFHAAYEKHTGTDWVKERDAYQFNRDEVVKALSETLGQSQAAAREVDRRGRRQLLPVGRELLQVGEGVPGLQGAAAPDRVPGR